jgi:hypothetical protein
MAMQVGGCLLDCGWEEFTTEATENTEDDDVEIDSSVVSLRSLCPYGLKTPLFVFIRGSFSCPGIVDIGLM